MPTIPFVIRSSAGYLASINSAVRQFRAMNKQIILPLIFFIFLSFLSKAQSKKLVDAAATKETKALYKNLRKLAKHHTLFGHQHATEYGHGWSGDENRSDVKSVTGSHPAVIGIDFSGFTGRTAEAIIQSKEVQRKIAQDTYNRGGVVTAAWHFPNPVSKGGFNWVDSVSLPAVKYIIPGGQAHAQYKEILKGIANWANSVRGNDGKLVPMIFRPFHEFDGGWFWWGKPHCTQDEFVALWRFTVSYMRDSLGVHQFIYAFSPDNRFKTEEEYLERYPGNEWVDIVGVDNYGDMGRYNHYDTLAAVLKLTIIDAYAKKAGKMAAFTETGLETIPNEIWWTNTLLKVMRSHQMNL